MFFRHSNYALRLFNTYGPGQNMSNMKQGMISIYLAQFLKNKEILAKDQVKMGTLYILMM